MRRTVMASLALCLLPALTLTAQELPKAKKYTDVNWYEIVHVQFKAGQAEGALKMVYDQFIPAVKAAGWGPIRILEHATGEWDVTYIFPMAEGPAGMEWEVSPDAEKFWAVLAEREGGAEEAQKLFKKYFKMVARGESQIVRERQ